MKKRFNSKKEVQKEVQQVQLSNLYLTIYVFLKRNQNPAKICSKYNVKKSKLQYYLSTLKKLNFIKKVGYGTWEITELGKDRNKWTSIGNSKRSTTLTIGSMTTPFKANLHALQIKIPIQSGKLKLKDGYVQKKLRGWQPEYKRILAPIGFTIKNNNNKSVSIYIFSREIPKDFYITPLVMKTVMYVYTLLKEKKVIIDILEAKVMNLHISVKNDDLDKVFNKGETFEVLLNRPCTKILEKDPVREAKAWTDESPYRGVETNDIKYKENLIMMPERIERLQDLVVSIGNNQNIFNTSIDTYNTSVNSLTEQMALHLKTMNNINGGITNMNNSINAFTNEIKQSRKPKPNPTEVINHLFQNPSKLAKFKLLSEREQNKILFGKEEL